MLGFDGRWVMAELRRRTGKKMTRKKVRITAIWIWWEKSGKTGRPYRKNQSGSWKRTMPENPEKEKIAEVREKMQEQNAQWFLLASLEDICWLLNVRGNDVECTPVVLSYLLMSEQQLYWYVQTEAVPASVRNTLAQDGVILREYEEIYTDVAGLPKANHGVG